ncbi:hypothetical protein SD71_11940 [Cohnella kolymensis]|uniref:Uncharacterized protein n=1 Tax=Cohnella kolymensis TaxID=1590652 RepID=A0ABR5A5I6_9BACL|nr:hypothetical protein [Cohnella kolymensis]KIL36023.1 hypothetical protein SD71_11940 [Cohnella kolymensis]
MNQTIKVDNKEINVSFSNYYDSALGDFMFTQVMCDVFMPGNEVVPVDIEKQQIRRIIDGFKKRKELSDEISKENIKGKSYYVINPRMRYDLGWLAGKKEKKPLTKELKAEAHEEPTPVTPEPPMQKPQPEQREYKDDRRKYLVSQGFKHNEATNNWELHGIRFPDSKIDTPRTDEEFKTGMNSLIRADTQNREKRKPKSK